MEMDFFYLFRRLLVVVCTVYAAVRLGQTAIRWHGVLWSGGRKTTVLRHYMMVQLLRVRLRRFTVDLLQIAALAGALAALIYLHRLVPSP